VLSPAPQGKLFSHARHNPGKEKKNVPSKNRNENNPATNTSHGKTIHMS
jgi:hypothetical protein